MAIQKPDRRICRVLCTACALTLVALLCLARGTPALAQQDPYDATSQDSRRDALPDIPMERLQLKNENLNLTGNDSVNIELPAQSRQETQDEYMQGIRRDAFDAAITGLFPLRPDEIQRLLLHYDETQKAAEDPPHGYPRPEVSVQDISLDPGAMPPVIRTAVGHVTTLTVLDVTGAPWPIQDVSWAGDFEIMEPEEGGHMIRIIPMAHNAYGNMSVRLLTLKTPITFSLRVDRETVDYRIDARVPEFGPLAETPLIDGGTQLVAGNALLTSVLDGVPPGGAEKLSVSGVDGRTTAWRINGMTYVRTPMTLLSPGWESSVSSADGMNVYVLADSPVLLLSDKGRFLRAHLAEKEDFFDE